MSDKLIQSVYFFGIGAIGAKYASIIYDYSPELVKVIADTNRIQRYQSEGIYVNDKKYDFDYVNVDNTNKEKADLIIIGVKSQQLDEVLEAIKSFVKEDTIVLSLLNGVHVGDRIGEMLGDEHVLYSIVYMDAVKDGNQISYKHIGKVVFGEKENTVHSEKVQRVVDLFEKIGIPYEIPENMRLGLWRKFLINVVVNQLSFIMNAPYRAFQDNSDVLILMQLIGEEVLAVANATGIPLNQADIDAMKETMRRIDRNGKTSMLQDRLNNRSSEVAIFAGEIIQLGQNTDIPTPYNQMILHLIQAMELEDNLSNKN